MGGPVDDDMANLIVAQLLYLDSVDQQKDITMYVNSPGGSVTAGETCAAAAAVERARTQQQLCAQHSCRWYARLGVACASLRTAGLTYDLLVTSLQRL